MDQKLISQPIDAKVATEMVNAYAKETATQNSKSYTKAVWFSGEQILNIAKTISDGTHDGLRIYFAQYVENTLPDLPESHVGRNTLLLVPTFAGVGGTVGGDDPHDDDTGDISNRGDMCPDACNGVTL